MENLKRSKSNPKSANVKTLNEDSKNLRFSKKIFKINLLRSSKKCKICNFVSKKSPYNDRQKSQKIQNVGTNWGKNIRKSKIFGEILKKTQKYYTMEPLKKLKSTRNSPKYQKHPTMMTKNLRFSKQ